MTDAEITKGEEPFSEWLKLKTVKEFIDMMKKE